MNGSLSIEEARALRQKRFSAAKLLIRSGESTNLVWNALAEMPDWCFYSATDITQLRNICGALLLAPAIRLWIDGKKIAELNKLIGNAAFDAVMNTELAVFPEYSTQLRNADTRQLVSTAGAATLGSSMPAALRHISVFLLQQESIRQVPAEIAVSITQSGLKIFNNIKGEC